MFAEKGVKGVYYPWGEFLRLPHTVKLAFLVELDGLYSQCALSVFGARMGVVRMGWFVMNRSCCSVVCIPVQFRRQLCSGGRMYAHGKGAGDNAFMRSAFVILNADDSLEQRNSGSLPTSVTGPGHVCLCRPSILPGAIFG